MNIEKNHDIKGKKISEKSLRLRFEKSIAGLPFFPKLLLISLLIFLGIISAFFVGCLSHVIILNIVIPSHYAGPVSSPNSKLELKSWVVSGIAFISITLWMIVTLMKNIVQGFKVTILFIFLVLSLCMIFRWLDTMYVLTTLFINLFCIILLLVSIFFVSLSLKIIYVVTQQYKYSLILYIFLYLSISAVSANFIFGLGLFDNPQTIYLKKQDILPAYVPICIIFGGLLFGLIIIIFSYLTTRHENNSLNLNNLKFFHTWAIAIGTWGGTSFYNLDLSHVNFRGSKLPNTDLRAKKLYRTCFQNVSGLDRAMVDNRYLDLDIPKVQQLLTKGYSDEKDFSHLNLRGAYLQNADLRGFNLTDTDLTGADLTGADLRRAILIRTQVIDVNLTKADLTGSCIKDWSYNYQTDFTEVQCQFYFRSLDEKGEKIDKFPNNRDFETREFESLYQELDNVIELIFSEG